MAPSEGTPPRAISRLFRSPVFAAAVIALAALAAYSGSFSGPFVFDDVPSVQENPTIRRLWPVWDALRPPPGGTTVSARPVLNLSFALNYAVSGREVWSYHAFNLAIHVMAGLALFGIVRRTLERGGAGDGRAARPGSRSAPDPLGFAFAAALIWTLHPLNSESVTLISDRSESLMGLFYLLTLYFFIRGTGGRDSTGWLSLSALCCLLGMATKEVMVSAPLAVLLYDRTFVAGSFGEAWRRRRRFHMCLASTWLLLCLVAIEMGGNRGGTAGVGTSAAWWMYALTQCRAIVHYLGLAFWPHPLVMDYGRSLVGDFRAVAPQALFLILLLAGTVAGILRRSVAGFLGACFFAILAPSSSFLPIATQTMAEHRMYLPLAAVVVAAVWTIWALASKVFRAARDPCVRLAGFLVIISALAAGLGFLTARRNLDYRSVLGLWQATARDCPWNADAHYNLGYFLSLEPGREPDAIAEYRTALRLDPNLSEAHNNLGNLLAGRQDGLDEAVSEYKAAIRIEPGYVEAHNNLGMALARRQGGMGDAMSEFRTALRLKPDFADAHVNLGNALSEEPGRLPEAIAEFDAALRMAPQSAEAHFNRANALFRTPGRQREALEEYQEVLRLKPGFAPAEAMVNRIGSEP